jgi:hypothetical protein
VQGADVVVVSKERRTTPKPTVEVGRDLDRNDAWARKSAVASIATTGRMVDLLVPAAA